MKKYPKEIDEIDEAVVTAFEDAHPVDKPGCYRAVERYAKHRAEWWEKRNEEHGVPERKEDQS